MKGFVLFNTKVGTHITSGVYEPGMGLRGVADLEADAITTATNIASMAFGVSLNARSAVGGDDLEDTDMGNVTTAEEGGDPTTLPPFGSSGHLSAFLESLKRVKFAGKTSLSPSGDLSPNSATLPYFDDGFTGVHIFEHKYAPIGALVTMATGVGGGRRIAEGICKRFVESFGVEYLDAVENFKKVKNYKKGMKPHVRAVVEDLARDSLESFIRQIDLDSSYVQWSTALYSPELSVAVDANNLTQEEIQKMLKLKRPPENSKKKKNKDKQQAGEGATAINLDLGDEDTLGGMQPHITTSFVHESLKASLFFDSFQVPVSSGGEASDGKDTREYSDQEGDDANEEENMDGSGSVIMRSGTSRERGPVLTATIFQLQSLAKAVPSSELSSFGTGGQRSFQVDMVVPRATVFKDSKKQTKASMNSLGARQESGISIQNESPTLGSANLQRVRVLASGDFYLVLALGIAEEGTRNVPSFSAQNYQHHSLSFSGGGIGGGSHSGRGVDALADLKQHTKALYRSVLRDE